MLVRNQFLGCSSNRIMEGRPALVGCPLDLTTTYRHGCHKAPQAIRASSDSIETFSPLFWGDLLDAPFSDIGDIEFKDNRIESCLDLIQETAASILEKKAIPLSLGGEHTITLPIVKAVDAVYPRCVVIQLDAHTDLRSDYEGMRLNHATVMRRIAELIGPDRIIQIGVRSGLKEEFEWMREHETLLEWQTLSERGLTRCIAGRPVYVTIDVDVLDPACMPATGNPEAGGLFYADLERFFRMMESFQVVGADVVELNPDLDPTEVGCITTAKIVREMLLLMAGTSR
ncbi:MAG: agmatinase [Desulfomonilaceae bacterium]